LSKWDFPLLKEKYEQLEISYEEVFVDIKDVIIKALISIEHHVCSKITKSHTQTHQCFDLFGFDILMDDSLTPWLLEVNMCPSLSSSSRLDKKIKTALMCDVFHLIGIQKFSHSEVYLNNIKESRKVESEIPYDPLIDDMTENTKLSPDDLETLMSFREEWNRAGENMQRIFPLRRNWKYYSKFFEYKRYNNYLLWRYLSSNQLILNPFKA